MFQWLTRGGLLSFFMIYLSMYDYSALTNAIIGASVKPVFTIGMGCFLLGMAYSEVG